MITAPISVFTIGAPIHRVMTLRKTGAVAGRMASALSTTSATSGVDLGVIGIARTLWATEGLYGFYAGWQGLLLKQAVLKPLFLPLSVMLKEQLSGALGSGSSFLAGGLTGTAMVLLTRPVTVATEILAADRTGRKGAYRGLGDVAKDMLESKRLLAGLGPSVCGIFIYRGLYFGLYDTFRDFEWAKNNGFWGMFALGMGVTATAQLAVYPISLVATNMAVASPASALRLASDGALRPHRGSRLLDVASHILNRHGVVGFFRGALPSAANTVVGAFFLVVFDAIRTSWA